MLLLAALALPLLNSVGQDAAAPSASVAGLARGVVQASGVSGGMCSVIGRADTDLAVEIARQGQFVVQCLGADAAAVGEMRRVIRAAGRYGTVSADRLRNGHLPYTDNLLNLIVVDSCPGVFAQGAAPAEVLRALAPLGTAFFNAANTDAATALAASLRTAGFADVAPITDASTWLRARKPWPQDIDEWTHYLHGADGNPVAQDRVVGPPARYQWVAGPEWLRSHETDSSVATLVTARGRLFSIVDEAPISLVGQHNLPDKWFVEARDAFNGVLLWQVPIRRWGWREWKESWFLPRPGDIPLNIQKRLVAVGDRVYVTLGYQAPVSMLDAASGAILKTYPETERCNEILCHNGTLILSVLDGKQARVMAVEAASGKPLWTSDRIYRGSTVDYIRWKEMNGEIKPPVLDPALNLATDGKTVAFIDGPDIVALDFKTGTETWRVPFPGDAADLTSGGVKSEGNLWVGTLIVTDGVVVHASPQKLAALAADTGTLLWSQPKKYIGHLWYEWKDVFVINGLVWTWDDQIERATFEVSKTEKQGTLYPRSAKGYDLRTGEMKKEMPLGEIFRANHHHRCYRNKATLRYILASRRGSEFVDLEQGKHTVDNWVRGTCHVGMMPANGLQYAPPHPCVCYLDEKLNGMNALAPGRAAPDAPGLPDGDHPVEKGPAFGQADAPAPTAADWPAYRHDSLRSGAATTQVPDDAKPLWTTPLGARVSPPVVVGDRLFAALVDQHHVVCLSTRDGAKQWEFAAGARVDSPPTSHNGMVLFGSADGWVYCLRVADGALAWRFRAAPDERLIGAFGQLESAWPVHGSVLVQNDTVYAAAGRTSMLDGGIFVFGLDPATGQPRCQTRLNGPHYTVDNIQENFRLPMGSLPDIMMGDGTAVYMRNLAFDAQLQPRTGRPALRAASGFLDDSYFKRTPWTFNSGRNYARIIVNDDARFYGTRMFDSLRGLDPTVFFTPGDKGYLLFAKTVQGNKDVWSTRLPVRVRAMVLTPGRLLIAGPPDVVDPADPLGAFEGRNGGLLYVVDTASGKTLSEVQLPSPPVFNGAAAANAQLFLADEAGSITSFGTR
ncbi:MAG: hypothetical protein A3K19_00120 [Lentisphaerae bacterium RIFOXYB12_FULL_65_16]|nr:MAG: hypothetical protein A3K18_10355 [Lentisphaerae bacterium RIFOXYA12_64_32]OGV86201.1 MAG: hypothetical protein A3K19_00120 [Lentisphaerae bacterium RIFOXYB12_FULL_65_16]